MAVRTFVANGAVITARRDGWVEVRQRTRPARSLDQDEYFLPREFYRPVEIHEWAGRARSTADSARLNRAEATTDTLGEAPQNLIISGTSRRVISPDEQVGWGMVTSSWTTAMHGCLRPLTWQASHFAITSPQIVADREFIERLDSAARIAESARTHPVDLQENAPLNQSEVSCISSPYGLRMPTRLTSGPSVPLEVMARFLVTKDGLVATASVTFYPELSKALYRRALAAMKQWRITGRRGGQAVDFRMHHPVIFFDSLRSDNHTDISGFRDAFLLTLRADGLLEQRGGFLPGRLGETGHVWSRTASAHAIASREVFRPEDARRWLNDVNRMRDSASSVAAGRDALPEIHEARLPGGVRWRADLGNQLGRRLTARFFRSPDATQIVGMELELSACAPDPSGSLLSHSVWSEHGWNHMVRVVDSSLALHPVASIDSNRVYGELEVTCVAKTHDAGLPSRAGRENSLAMSLALNQDAIVTFIVDRSGDVDRESIYVMGKWRAADRNRIAAAISGLRYTPATFAGVRVAQRAHLLIPALDPAR